MADPTAKREIVTDLVASLTAAVSLLKRGPKQAAPSDRMFDQMIIDYERAIERGRTFLAAEANWGSGPLFRLPMKVRWQDTMKEEIIHRLEDVPDDRSFTVACRLQPGEMCKACGAVGATRAQAGNGFNDTWEGDPMPHCGKLLFAGQP